MCTPLLFWADKWWKNSASTHSWYSFWSLLEIIEILHQVWWTRTEAPFKQGSQGTTGNVALLLPNPFPLPLVSYQFACLLPFTKIMIAFSCWATANRWRHLFTCCFMMFHSVNPADSLPSPIPVKLVGDKLDWLNVSCRAHNDGGHGHTGKRNVFVWSGIPPELICILSTHFSPSTVYNHNTDS